MLHMINKSPFSSGALELAARFFGEDDKVLLYEDGVFAAAAGTSFEKKLGELTRGREVFALQADLKARGITKTAPQVKVVDYGGFVDLVAANKTDSWL